MSKFYQQIDLIYQAVRKTYGYGDEADELIDLLGEMAELLDNKLNN